MQLLITNIVFYKREEPGKQDVTAQAMSIFLATWASRDVDGPPRQSGIGTHRAEIARPADTRAGPDRAVVSGPLAEQSAPITSKDFYHVTIQSRDHDVPFEWPCSEDRLRRCCNLAS